MPKAVWNKNNIATSNVTLDVDGYTYFPKNSIKMEFLKESNHTTVCSWKGECNYYDLIQNNIISKNAAWEYRNPKDAAKKILGHVAFWKDVEIIR